MHTPILRHIKKNFSLFIAIPKTFAHITFISWLFHFPFVFAVYVVVPLLNSASSVNNYYISTSFFFLHMTHFRFYFKSIFFFKQYFCNVWSVLETFGSLKSGIIQSYWQQVFKLSIIQIPILDTFFFFDLKSFTDWRKNGKEKRSNWKLVFNKKKKIIFTVNNNNNTTYTYKIFPINIFRK